MPSSICQRQSPFRMLMCPRCAPGQDRLSAIPGASTCTRRCPEERRRNPCNGSCAPRRPVDLQTGDRSPASGDADSVCPDYVGMQAQQIGQLVRAGLRAAPSNPGAQAPTPTSGQLHSFPSRHELVLREPGRQPCQCRSSEPAPAGERRRRLAPVSCAVGTEHSIRVLRLRARILGPRSHARTTGLEHGAQERPRSAPTTHRPRAEASLHLYLAEVGRGFSLNELSSKPPGSGAAPRP